MKKKKIAAIIAVALIICIAVGLFFAFKSKEQHETTIAAPTGEITSANKKNLTVPAEYAEYYNINNDFVGWIKIDGTEIDYPVVQGADNDYYLSHNFKKEKESRGTIFMAYDCDAKLGSKNTVIHGHNWLDDSVFSPLVQYSDFEFYKKHPVIEFNTRNEMHKWKIIAVFITSADENEDNGYIFNYVYPNMGGENFKPYSEELKKRTLFDTGVDYNESDKFLTLSTCTREVDKGKKRADCRIVVVSRMVRENETAYVDTSKSIMNENPKYPQIWYNNKGLSKIINNLDVIIKGLAGNLSRMDVDVTAVQATVSEIKDTFAALPTTGEGEDTMLDIQGVVGYLVADLTDGAVGIRFGKKPGTGGINLAFKEMQIDRVVNAESNADVIKIVYDYLYDNILGNATTKSLLQGVISGLEDESVTPEMKEAILGYMELSNEDLAYEGIAAVAELAGRELPAPVEPTDPAEPTDPTDPTNPTKPSEPTTTPADNTTKADTNNTNKTVNNTKIPNTGAEAETAFTAILSAAAGVALLSIVAAYTLKRKARNI